MYLVWIHQYLNVYYGLLGLKHCLIALTSDHGVGMVPEYAIERGKSAGRFDHQAFVKKLEQAMIQQFGAHPWNREYVLGMTTPWL